MNRFWAIIRWMNGVSSTHRKASQFDGWIIAGPGSPVRPEHYFTTFLAKKEESPLQHRAARLHDWQ